MCARRVGCCSLTLFQYFIMPGLRFILLVRRTYTVTGLILQAFGGSLHFILYNEHTGAAFVYP